MIFKYLFLRLKKGKSMKYFLFTLLVTIGFVQINAQDEDEKKIKGQFRISPNISFNFNLPSSDSLKEESLGFVNPEESLLLTLRSESIDYGLGFPTDDYHGYELEFDQLNYSVGVDCEYLIFNNFSLNFGINYSNKDFSATPFSKISMYAGYTTSKANKALFKLRAVEIPVIMRYYINLNKKISLFVNLGFINQLNIVSKDNVTPYLRTGNLQNFWAFPETFLSPEKFVLNGVAGIGASYKLNSNSGFQLSVNYTQGLTKTYNSDSLDSSINEGYLDSHLIFNYLQTKLSFYINI